MAARESHVPEYRVHVHYLLSQRQELQCLCGEKRTLLIKNNELGRRRSRRSIRDRDLGLLAAANGHVCEVLRAIRQLDGRCFAEKTVRPAEEKAHAIEFNIAVDPDPATEGRRQP